MAYKLENEWHPELESEQWIKKSDDYYEYDDIPEIRYGISDETIEKSLTNEKYKSIYGNISSLKKNRIIESDPFFEIYKFYILYSPQYEKYMVKYTTHSILNNIKYMLINYDSSDEKNIFGDDIENMLDVNIKMVKIYKIRKTELKSIIKKLIKKIESGIIKSVVKKTTAKKMKSPKK